jgi:hypothetical protein
VPNSHPGAAKLPLGIIHAVGFEITSSALPLKSGLPLIRRTLAPLAARGEE